jgi:RHS repeat-associated protein
VIDEVRVSAVARYGDTLTPDSSGNENDGALAGAAAIVDGGRFDKALALDGVDAYVEIPDDAALELAGDCTIEAWVFPEALTGTRHVVAKWASPSGGKLSYRLYLEDGIPKLGLSLTGTAVYVVAGTVAVPLDEWTHVAATRAGDAVKLLVNEAEVASGALAGALHDGGSALRIGASGVIGAEGFFEGKIDEVRISSADKGETLSTLEVNYRYNARNQLTVEYAGPTLTAPDLPTDASVKTYTYDRNGNVTDIVETVGAVEIAAEHMDYDELNRMLTHTGPAGTETFTYRGAEWHRASANGTSFLYDGDNVLADIAGGVTNFYVTPFLDQNLSITKAAGTYYYSQDGLGSVRTLTDSAGAVVNSSDYLPFGGAHQPGTNVTVQQRYTYTGRERNPSSSLMYYRYRQYDPRVGRFGGRDPIGYRGGMNLLAYVGNRSAMRRDPRGQGLLDDVIEGFWILWEYEPDDGDDDDDGSTDGDGQGDEDDGGESGGGEASGGGSSGDGSSGGGSCCVKDCQHLSSAAGCSAPNPRDLCYVRCLGYRDIYGDDDAVCDRETEWTAAKNVATLVKCVGKYGAYLPENIADVATVCHRAVKDLRREPCPR